MRMRADGGWITCIALAVAIGVIAVMQGRPGTDQLTAAAGIIALIAGGRALDRHLAIRARRALAEQARTPAER